MLDVNRMRNVCTRALVEKKKMRASQIYDVPCFPAGVKYAMISMKLMMVAVLRRYSVHTECKLSDIKMEIDLLAKKADGYPVTIRLRTNRTQKPGVNTV